VHAEIASKNEAKKEPKWRQNGLPFGTYNPKVSEKKGSKNTTQKRTPKGAQKEAKRRPKGLKNEAFPHQKRARILSILHYLFLGFSLFISYVSYDY